MAIKTHEIRKGLQSTVDAKTAQKPKARSKKESIEQPKAPKAEKEPKTPRKKAKKPEAPLTREQIEDALKDIALQRDRHLKDRFECNKELKSLQASFTAVKAERKAKVNEILEKNFMDQGEKSLVNKILVSKIQEPKLHQLIDNIEKLKAQSDWHTKNIKGLDFKERGLRVKLINLDADEKARAAYEIYKCWQEAYFAAEDSFEKLKNVVISLRAVENDPDKRFSKVGITDYIFINIVSSKFRGDLIHREKMSTLVDSLSRMHLNAEKNPFYSRNADRRRINSEKKDMERFSSEQLVLDQITDQLISEII